jgi:hypothetical protein
MHNVDLNTDITLLHMDARADYQHLFQWLTSIGIHPFEDAKRLVRGYNFKTHILGKQKIPPILYLKEN